MFSSGLSNLFNGRAFKSTPSRPAYPSFSPGKMNPGAASVPSAVKPKPVTSATTKALNKKSFELLQKAAAYGGVSQYLQHHTRKAASYDELVSYIRICHTARKLVAAAKGDSK